MTNISYANIIAELVSVANMPTDCVDMMEEKDHYADIAQMSLDYFVEESNSFVELKAVKAVADAFHYQTRIFDEKMAYLQMKAQRFAHFDYEFEMATQQVQEEKHHQMESLFVAYEATQAALSF